jgi:hypothetical protein
MILTLIYKKMMSTSMFSNVHSVEKNCPLQSIFGTTF